MTGPHPDCDLDHPQITLACSRCATLYRERHRVMAWPFPGLVIPDPEPPWTWKDTLAVLSLLLVAGAIAAVILL